MVAVRVPFLKQSPSENSHSMPLPALLVGQATGPLGPRWSECWQMPVVEVARALASGLRPFGPPMQVSKTFGSVKDCRGVGLCGCSLVTELQISQWPISCCMSTPPSSAAHGTWFCCLAVLYSAWKVNGMPEQS